MRRLMIAVVALTGLLAFTGAVLILANRAPDVPPISADEIASTKPYVVKLHARWCPICMVTKDAWASVQEAYVGEVRFVVFDFTNAATTEASRAQAARLGLGVLFEQYSGETGSVLVLDGKSREVLHDLHGHRDQVEYRAAIGATLAGMAQHK